MFKNNVTAVRSFVKRGAFLGLGVGALVGSVNAATYDALTAAVNVTEVSVAIVALAAILIGPQVVLWCVNKLRGMLGHR